MTDLDSFLTIFGRPGNALAELNSAVVSCRRCPRLVAYREQVAREKREQYLAWSYWGKPVPGFGDPAAHLLIVGLAPAAHGGNRTGRVFTGDKSGDFLIASLYRAGFSNQPTSLSRNDGLRLRSAYMTAAVKCIPPGNKPDSSEIDNCSRFLRREIEIFRRAVAVLCLGQIAYRATLDAMLIHYQLKRPIPNFRHGLEVNFGSELPRVFASYHPSPRNTQTKRLTERMLLSLLSRIRKTLQVYRPALTGSQATGRAVR